MSPLQQFVTQLTAKKYASNTIKSYRSALSPFLDQLAIPIDQAGADEVQQYLQQRQGREALSCSSQKQLIGAVKLFYKELYDKDIAIDHLYPNGRKQQSPVVLTKAEVHQLLKALDNLKHKTVLTCIYSAGLRISEVIHLQLGDIHTKRMTITVRGTKGYKDREVALSEKLLQLLKAYNKTYRPQKWLFEGHKGNCYSATSIQKIFKKALQQTNINKKASAQTLRHSYAYHLLSNGIDIRHVQYCLGHQSIKSTQRYLNLVAAQPSVLRSPLDSW